MAPTDAEIREMAQARVAFRWNAFTYVLVNAFLIGFWFYTNPGETPSLRGESTFWPIWVLGGWGLGLAFHAYSAYGPGVDAVAREEEKIRQKFGRT